MKHDKEANTKKEVKVGIFKTCVQSIEEHGTQIFIHDDAFHVSIYENRCPV